MSRFAACFVAVAGLLTSLSQVACSAEQEVFLTPEVQRLQNEVPKRILFVGNSYLYYNDSLHNHVRRIAEEIGPYKFDEYEYKSATIGGARLSHHHIDNLLESGRLGIDEPFDLVVLQGGSAEVLTEENRAQFRESAMGMSKKARATGAEVALYMTHAYVEPDERYEPNLINKIRPTYVSVGNELDALVIPVGLAFELAYERRPDIELHKTFDGTHPSLLGTYLAACVVYQSIYGTSTVGIEYDYFGAIDEDDAVFLRGIADQTVREFFGHD
jgi:hypothetical protein